jgi:aryl-alcohol dehydrogenase-like predicted oxidoreductase
MEYVDIIFAHRPDFHTPLEEVCRAFDFLIKKGYAFYWGTSEWPADMITDAIRFCEEKGLSLPVVE